MDRGLFTNSIRSITKRRRRPPIVLAKPSARFATSISVIPSEIEGSRGTTCDGVLRLRCAPLRMTTKGVLLPPSTLPLPLKPVKTKSDDRLYPKGRSPDVADPGLQRYRGVLATLAYLAPLLGLLGTVAGMINAFGTLSSNGGYATVTELSSGVYKSLLTTAAGLVVATPTFVAYSYLSSRVNTLMHEMERAGIEIVQMLTETEPESGIISFQPTAEASPRDLRREK